MKQAVSFSTFSDAFRDMNRKDQFSYDGLRALYDYLEEYEESCDTEVELDVIALCCEFTEYTDLAELQQNYTNIESMDDLNDHTIVIEIPDSDGFIIQDY